MAPQEILEGGAVDAPIHATAKENDIPIVDLGPWVSGDGSEEEKDRVSKEIFEAFCTIGFVIVVNHGVEGDASEDGGTTHQAFTESQKFFSLPKETKLKSAYKDPASNRGYISMGQEKLDAQLPDIKETFDIGFEGEVEYQNEWPTEALGEGFKTAMLNCFNEYDQLHLTILRALARGMGLGDDDYFTPLCNGNHQNLRLLHYPECDREAITKSGQKRGGIHTDYGTITLVSQQKVSGLVAQRLDGSWAAVPPYPGGIVVNVGEMLQRWSNDILRATPHQILDDDPLSGTEKPARVPERYSIAFFCNANKETSLECLPVCHGPGNPPKYEPINAHEYITMRLSTTIPVPKSTTKTCLAGVALNECILNSANPFATSLENLLELAGSPATGAITTRTACPNFVHDDGVHQWRNWGDAANTINCLGYSCHSFDYYLECIQGGLSSTTTKPVILSISGYAGEVAGMLARVAEAVPPSDEGSSPVVLVEINLSCPNIPGKPPIAYDFEGMSEYLTEVFANGHHGLAVGVKLAPYFYEDQFLAASKTINAFKGSIGFVTTINTVGCGLVVDTASESPVLWEATNGGSSGFGGLGGSAVRATALGNVRRLRQLLHPSIDLVGCGGIDSGEAAFSHLLCGATAVMVASALLTHGVEILDKIRTELLEIMQAKGYTSIDDFRGKLKDGWEGWQGD